MNALEKEAANPAAALLELLKGIVNEIPELATAMQGGTRIAFDTYERILTVCPTDEHGRSPVLLAIPCDPENRRDVRGDLRPNAHQGRVRRLKGGALKWRAGASPIPMTR